jgi:hypothetical protein
MPLSLRCNYRCGTVPTLHLMDPYGLRIVMLHVKSCRYSNGLSRCREARYNRQDDGEMRNGNPLGGAARHVRSADPAVAAER